jgi:hypothetical protein
LGTPTLKNTRESWLLAEAKNPLNLTNPVRRRGNTVKEIADGKKNGYVVLNIKYPPARRKSFVVRGEGVTPPTPNPFCSRLLDRYVKTT